MPGISRGGRDKAGGTMIASQSFCFCEGSAIVVKGDSVIPHYPCGMPGGAIHCAATMSQGSNYVFVGGKSVVRQGDMASCSHTAQGSSKIFAM